MIKEMESLKKNITEEEMSEEMAAMIRICFEGNVENEKGILKLTLPCGQKFSIFVKKNA